MDAALPFQPKPRRDFAEEDLAFEPGDFCETLTLVTLRREESVLSEIIAELPEGLGLKVLELGESAPRLRARVAAGNLQGWITARTSSNKPHICKKPQGPAFGLQDIHVDESYQVKSLLLMREGEGCDTPVVAELRPYSVVHILEFDHAGRRARVQAAAQEGWITLVTHVGMLLLERVTDFSRRRKTASFSANNTSTGGISMAKEFLELARAGNTVALRELVEGGSAEWGLPGPPVDINCSDVRGRTPLMYAAHAGSLEATRYLLSFNEVLVNALDDTQKTPLHHAARHPEQVGDERRELVKLLVKHGAMVDARDQNGCTALMLAAATGDAGVLEALLEAGAKVNAKDFEGRTPQQYAANLGRAELEKRLLAAGACEAEESFDAGSPSRRRSLAFTGRRDSCLRQSILRRHSMSRGHLGLARMSLASIAAQPGSRRPTLRQSVFWTAGLAGAGADGEPDGEVIAVDEPPDEPGISEEERAKERALSRLEAVMAEGAAAAPLELESAIAEAAALGVEEAQLQMAKECVESLRERARAHDALLAAMAERNPAELREAIAKAEECSVPSSEVDRARAVLAEEEPKQKAWEKLAEAQDRGDSAPLRDALAQAKEAGIPPDELAPFEELLRGAESKDQAEVALTEAIEAKDVIALRFALEQARGASADPALITRGEEVLKQEEPLHEVRQLLEQVEEGAAIPELRALLAKAKEVGLESEEYSDVQEMLEHEEAKEKALEEVRLAVATVKDVDRQSMDSLTAARERLASVVQRAIDAGVVEADLRDASLQRRRLHNAIQDLKGAIRVFCRIRPLNSREKELGDTQIVVPGEDGLSLRVEAEVFSFDAVFAPGTQEEVFEECKDLVQSALDGYNVTIFAYGQTGAGKTFTMYGAPGVQGTAPRTLQELFRLVDQGRDRFTYTVMGSMMELYRNELVDLLVRRPAMRGSTISTMSKGSSTAPPKLKVNVNKAGVVQVEHLIEEECSSAEELAELLERGNSQRTVAATAMNSESSRSHLLVVVTVVSVNRETGEQVRGKILMCDLAGSERLKKSEVTGDMQKEAIEINKSLTALGDVIECLTKGKSHVPYRNHTLTQVMQDALGGSSKTLMFVNCSPASSNADETLMALKYATRAKHISNDTRRKK